MAHVYDVQPCFVWCAGSRHRPLPPASGGTPSADDPATSLLRRPVPTVRLHAMSTQFSCYHPPWQISPDTANAGAQWFFSCFPLAPASFSRPQFLKRPGTAKSVARSMMPLTMVNDGNPYPLSLTTFIHGTACPHKTLVYILTIYRHSVMVSQKSYVRHLHFCLIFTFVRYLLLWFVRFFHLYTCIQFFVEAKGCLILCW